MTELTKQYQAATEAHDVAIRIYHVARDQYRNMEIEDDEFLAAKVAYDAATQIFDEAFNSYRFDSRHGFALYGEAQ